VKLSQFYHSFRVFHIDIELMQSSLAINEQLFLGKVPQRSLKRLEHALIAEIKGEILTQFLSFLDKLMNFLLTELIFVSQHCVEFL